MITSSFFISNFLRTSESIWPIWPNFILFEMILKHFPSIKFFSLVNWSVKGNWNFFKIYWIVPFASKKSNFLDLDQMFSWKFPTKAAQTTSLILGRSLFCFSKILPNSKTFRGSLHILMFLLTAFNIPDLRENLKYSKSRDIGFKILTNFSEFSELIVNNWDSLESAE